MNQNVSIIIYPRSYNKRGDVSLHSVQGVTSDGVDVNIKLRVDGRHYPFGDIPSIKEFSRTDIKAKNACVASPLNSMGSREGVLLFTGANLDHNNRRGIPSYVARWGHVLATDSDSDSPLIGHGRFFCVNNDMPLTGSPENGCVQFLSVNHCDIDRDYKFSDEYGYLVHLSEYQFECNSNDSELQAVLSGDESVDYKCRGFSLGFSVKAVNNEGAVVKETYQEYAGDTVSASILRHFFENGFIRLAITPIIYKKFSIEKDLFLKTEEELGRYVRSLLQDSEDFFSYKIAIRRSENPLYSFFRLSDSIFHPARLSSNVDSLCWFSSEPKPKPSVDGAIVRTGMHGMPISRSIWLISGVGFFDDDSSIMDGATDQPQTSDDNVLLDLANSGKNVDPENNVDIVGRLHEDPVLLLPLDGEVEGAGSSGDIDLKEDVLQNALHLVDIKSRENAVNVDIQNGKHEEVVLLKEEKVSADTSDKKVKKKGMADFIRR